MISLTNSAKPAFQSRIGRCAIPDYAPTMRTIFRLFQEHPASVGESYLQHMLSSFSFGASMLFASMAALVHGMLPFLFVATGSNTISRLHERMVTHRNRVASRHR
ncbi:MAG: DUF6356 family protein [Cupriavidus necator]|jgi:uncharacterized protein DUF6356|uniref:DUF6356 family protein n=1 Tax=Cupriavidus necator TaxID=106590 RepID=UPI003DB3B322